MSAEAYSFPEGSLHIWTGSATASAQVAYCENVNLALVRGWDNRPTLSGYTDHLTGQRADLTIGTMFTYNATLAKMFDSATAMHVKVLHNNVNGSAGWVLYSGRMDVFAPNEAQGTVMRYTMSMHFNRWSAFGGG